MMPRLRLAFLAAAAVFGFFFILPRLYNRSSFDLPSWASPDFDFGALQRGHSPTDEITDREVLLRLGLTPAFEYRRHCIQAKPKYGLKRESLVDVSSESLLADGWGVTVGDDFDILPPCEHWTTVDVPSFDDVKDVDTSSLMLGVATNLDRVEPSLHAFSRWLAHTGSILIIVLVDQPDLEAEAATINAIQSKAEALNMKIVLEPFADAKKYSSEGIRNFALANAFIKHRGATTQWFSVIDDDTFFVSLPRMLQALKPYDPTKQWYIGALTEGLFRIAKEGFKAWGGAGFFISPPLMEALSQNYERCIKLDEGFGDLLWRDCILEVTSPTVGLTELRGLNQMDVWKDISGWYEAPHNPLLTVHHWKSWHFHPIPIAHLVTDVTGPDTFMQRYRFADDLVLTNGFSAVYYPRGLPDLNLVELTMVEEVEKTTWPDKVQFEHSLGKTRPALQIGTEKVSWKFADAVLSDGGDTVRQFYIKKAGKDGNPTGIDNVIEVDWKRG